MIKPLKQIFMTKENANNDYVRYENQLKPRISYDIYDCDRSKEELWEVYKEHESNLLEIVRKETTAYLYDERLCNNDENMFPQWNRLTGEWYISDISINCDDDGDIFVGITTRFTENFIMEDGSTKVIDYLGMEVHSFFDSDKDKFIFDVIDTLSI